MIHIVEVHNRELNRGIRVYYDGRIDEAVDYENIIGSVAWWLPSSYVNGFVRH